MSKFTNAMKKVGKAFDDTANLIKKLDPNPIDVLAINLVQLSIKELAKEVDDLQVMVLTDPEE